MRPGAAPDAACSGAAQENIYRNFGMPQPNGYRKALRFMRHADHFGFPIITFVDTPGAYAGKAAEELGQVRGRVAPAALTCDTCSQPCALI
jgi:acetyl-CoA carboxylase alpha subunit